jgi:hypothetical protein
MNWQETSPNIWVLNLGNGTVTLTVFKSRYELQCWHFSINDKDNTEPFQSLQAAKDAGLKLAIAQIDHTLRHLAEAKQEAEALLPTEQTRAKESVELEH